MYVSCSARLVVNICFVLLDSGMHVVNRLPAGHGVEGDWRRAGIIARNAHNCFERR